MDLRGPVLVGTDLTDAADEALRAGAELARALKSRLVVCHVVPELVPEGSLFDQFRTTNRHARESVLANARLAVQAQLNSVLDDPHAGGVDIVLETGTPHVGLLRQAEQTSAGVMVVWPGAAATDVVRRASTVVLVARRSPRGPVVGASDFSIDRFPRCAWRQLRRGAVMHRFTSSTLSTSRRSQSAVRPRRRCHICKVSLGLRSKVWTNSKRGRSGASRRRSTKAVYWARPSFPRVRLPKLLSDMPNRSLRSSWWLARRGAAASSF